MSKKNKTQQKEKEDQTLSILAKGDIYEAESITIMPIMKDFQLSQLNNTIVLQYFKEMANGNIVQKNQNLSFQLYGRKIHFKIIQVQEVPQPPKEVNEDEEEEEEEEEPVIIDKFLITKRTTLKLVAYVDQSKQQQQDQEQGKDNDLNKEQKKDEEIFILAGMDIFQTQLENYIKMALFKQEKFDNLGFPALKGILISGPSGTGKTKLVKKVAQKLNQLNQDNQKIKSYIIESKTLLSRVVGEGEKKIEGIFENAAKNSPAVIFFDDLHVIASKKDSNSQTIIATLSAEIDKITSSSKVLVIGATNQAGKLDESIKRAGRFDKEIKIDIPKATDRKQIFQAYLQKTDHNLSEQDITDINYQMNGFSGADIVGLMREALLGQIQNENDNENDSKLNKSHFENALSEIQPSGIKEILMDIPKVFWSDIGGYSHVKDEIKKVTEWPLKHPEAFVRMGISPSKGILLYGPPGCSKTMIAKAIATESKLNFLAVKGPELFSKYVGDSEKAVREVFRRARMCAPSVIFFDEIDAIATQRSVNTDVSERVLCQMLNEMDGIEGLKSVVIIAATNRPEIIDKALTRPGRFDHLIYVPPPNMDNRLDILKINVYGNKMPVEDNINLNSIAFQTESYSGAELCLICREAGLSALSRDIHCEKVTQADFESAMKKVKPRITQQMITQYTQFQDNLKFF